MPPSVNRRDRPRSLSTQHAALRYSLNRVIQTDAVKAVIPSAARNPELQQPDLNQRFYSKASFTLCFFLTALTSIIGCTRANSIQSRPRQLPHRIHAHQSRPAHRHRRAIAAHRQPDFQQPGLARRANEFHSRPGRALGNTRPAYLHFPSAPRRQIPRRAPAHLRRREIHFRFHHVRRDQNTQARLLPHRRFRSKLPTTQPSSFISTNRTPPSSEPWCARPWELFRAARAPKSRSIPSAAAHSVSSASQQDEDVVLERNPDYFGALAQNPASPLPHRPRCHDARPRIAQRLRRSGHHLPRGSDTVVALAR